MVEAGEFLQSKSQDERGHPARRRALVIVSVIAAALCIMAGVLINSDVQSPVMTVDYLISG